MTDPTQAPRDPGHYQLSQHAYQRRKNRGIRYEEVAETIENGIVQSAKGGYPSVKFVDVPMGVSNPIAVVANAEDGVISTVYWDWECSHPQIVRLCQERGIEAGGQR